MIKIIQKIGDYFAHKSITFYQKYISPYKGFCCAYRHRTGGHSCSSFALKIVRRYGAVGLIRALPKQFKRCELAYLATQEEREEEEKKKKNGVLDWCAVDPCDCTPDMPKGCHSNPTDGGAGGCGDVNLDCNVLDGCGSPLESCDVLDSCGTPFEACSCIPTGYKKPMWKKLFKKS